eukprot:TRINITY_DN1097_c0_g3_i1.p1 TRINITY_DN1097_c0_g3~~TRINITY_DN1097_c0_g3_i1.p1  ORF type:complete len:385 (+),score=54.58 TRINITY_DN1097_c0_g3_i1:64-1218(+)
MAFPAKIVYTRSQNTYLAQNLTDPSAECNAEMAAAFYDVDVNVNDARRQEATQGPFSITTSGFCLVKDVKNSLPASKYMKGDNEAVQKTAYPEVIEAVHRVFPGAEVVPFHHAARSSTSTSFAGAVRAPARNAHADYSVASAMDFIADRATPRQQKGRFMIINAWRSVGDTPITNHHLALCDGRSVIAPDDFVTTGFIQPGNSPTQSYSLDPGAAHRHVWWYYPNMIRSEVLLFMQYDSDPRSPTRFCFHTAISNTTQQACLRQSCEVRMLVFIPNPDPNVNTIRTVFPPTSVGAKSKMLEALKYPDMWPSDARHWIARGVYKGGSSVRSVLIEWIDFSVKNKEFGIDKLSEIERRNLVEDMMDGDIFEKSVKENFDKPKWYQY